MKNEYLYTNTVIKICEVISVDDQQKGDRIKVRLYPEDDRKLISEIPYAYPLLPKMFHVLPKVGEAVLILLTAANNGNSNRYYIGPIISQPQKMDYDGFSGGALSLYPDTFITPKVAHDRIPDAKGAFCNDEDIAIYGRKGCDIIMKEDDIRIRCGARVDDDNSQIGQSFNKLSPAYLKLKYNEIPKEVTNDTTGFIHKYNSTATLVADQINLISNEGKTYFNTTDNKDLISDEEMEKIMKKAHLLPYGDTLVEFLDYFLRMFREHAHPYPGMPTILPSGNENFFNYDLKQILSKNVRIN